MCMRFGARPKSKPFGTVISKQDDACVRDLGAEYAKCNPRSVEG